MAKIMQARETNGQAVEMGLTCCISSVALLMHSQNWQALMCHLIVDFFKHPPRCQAFHGHAQLM